MKLLRSLRLLPIIALVGCGGKPSGHAPPPAWNITPGQSNPNQAQPTPFTVFVQGPVRYPKILYTEGMTLSRAILTAQYSERQNPRTIVIVRHGERYPVDPNSLLRGEQDPVIEPGDLIELQP
jgi:hypothetical protein